MFFTTVARLRSNFYFIRDLCFYCFIQWAGLADAPSSIQEQDGLFLGGFFSRDKQPLNIAKIIWKNAR